jgi:hypothetical protein
MKMKANIRNIGNELIQSERVENDRDTEHQNGNTDP